MQNHCLRVEPSSSMLFNWLGVAAKTKSLRQRISGKTFTGPSTYPRYLHFRSFLRADLEQNWLYACINVTSASLISWDEKAMQAKIKSRVYGKRHKHQDNLDDAFASLNLNSEATPPQEIQKSEIWSSCSEDESIDNTRWNSIEITMIFLIFRNNVDFGIIE